MVSSHFRFDVFFQLWERRPYARLNLFPEDSTRSRTNICDIATRSRRHRDIVWIFDDVRMFYRATNRILRDTLSSVKSLVSIVEKNIPTMRIDRFVSIIFDRCELKFMKFINFKGGHFLVSRTFFTRSIFVFTRINIIRVIETHTWSMPSKKRGNCVGSRANGRVISLLIAPAAGLIQPRNRSSFDRWLVDNRGTGHLIWTIRHRERRYRWHPT